MVKVIVDNTLGRLWLQMHPDSVARSPKGPPPLPQERPTDLPLMADYLVPRTGEKIRYRRIDDYGNPQPSNALAISSFSTRPVERCISANMPLASFTRCTSTKSERWQARLARNLR